MATLQTNTLLKGFSGSIGKFVIKRVGNKTILTHKPRQTGKQSEKQRQNRLKFKAASVYAKHLLQDPQKKAYYLKKAKKLNLTNAYTAVITDYMRKGEIKEISTKSNAKKGGTVKVKVFKKHFAINKVSVSIYNEQGKFVETGMAIRKGIDEFFFTPSTTQTLLKDYTVKAIIEDHGLNKVEKQITLAG
ncbi:hypothetical protein [Chryseosolibacter indicus]|uniref:Uncharacterized protein n=1 Tax=Chryseosolibacter indicus TaxID=2782351 RepID=A0ABS5VKM0_9BACT|nr:hypothetical protein [Chryseosolibacter indicus]MBT1701987.1 hypothetical protein [Chryseosolibacter indicus]